MPWLISLIFDVVSKDLAKETVSLSNVVMDGKELETKLRRVFGL
jgi:hypothetical protein